MNNCTRQNSITDDLIEAGALRQYRHNDGSEGFIFAYDKATTDRIFAHLHAELAAARQRAEQFEQSYEKCFRERQAAEDALAAPSRPSEAQAGEDA